MFQVIHGGGETVFPDKMISPYSSYVLACLGCNQVVDKKEKKETDKRHVYYGRLLPWSYYNLCLYCLNCIFLYTRVHIYLDLF